VGEATTMTAAETLVREAFAAWAAGTGTVFDLLADDVSWTITGTGRLAGTYRSKREFVDRAIGPIGQRLAQPIRPAVRLVVARDDWVSVLWDGHAVARDGRPYDNTYSWFLRVADGRVREVIAFYDGADLEDLFDRVPPAG
jgi:ketosteroid isomerase-like protein